MTSLPPYIWQLRGDDPDGPNVVILGGVHGDEITGVQLVGDWLGVIHPEVCLSTQEPGIYSLMAKLGSGRESGILLN